MFTSQPSAMSSKQADSINTPQPAAPADASKELPAPKVAPTVEADPYLERSFRGHTGAVTAVAFSPTMRQIASGGEDGVVMVWNFKPQLRAFRFYGHQGAVTSVCFSPDGSLLASASADNTVRLWEPSIRGKSAVLHTHSGPVTSVSFSPDGRLLLTSSFDEYIKIWNVATRKFVCSLKGHNHWVRAACFSPDGMLVASAGEDKTVKLWDIAQRECIHTYMEHSSPVRCVKFHPGGSIIASGSMDNTIKLWDIRTHQLLQHYAAHSAPVTSLAFHPSGHYLISASADSTIKIWSLKEGVQLFTIHGHTASVNCITFSPKGEYFASGGSDSMLITWRSGLPGVGSNKVATTLSSNLDPKSAKKTQGQSSSSDDSEGESIFSSKNMTVAPSTALTTAISGLARRPTAPASGAGTAAAASTAVPATARGNLRATTPTQQQAPSKSALARPSSAVATNSTGVVRSSQNAGGATSAPVDIRQHQPIPAVGDTVVGAGGSRAAQQQVAEGGAAALGSFTASPADDLVTRLPHDVALTLSRVVTQLDAMAHVMTAFESRLNTQERLLRQLDERIALYTCQAMFNHEQERNRAARAAMMAQNSQMSYVPPVHSEWLMQAQQRSSQQQEQPEEPIHQASHQRILPSTYQSNLTPQFSQLPETDTQYAYVAQPRVVSQSQSQAKPTTAYYNQAAHASSYVPPEPVAESAQGESADVRDASSPEEAAHRYKQPQQRQQEPQQQEPARTSTQGGNDQDDDFGYNYGDFVKVENSDNQAGHE